MIKGVIFDMDGVLALGLDRAAQESAQPQALDADVEARIEARQQARKARDFATADRIRDELKSQGIEITDIPGGAKWKRV